jgi:hypothetical protein
MKRRRSSHTPRVQLTARDLAIFEKLRAAGWLSTGQLLKYFFADKSPNAVSKRLRKLAAASYLAAARTSSTEPAFYRLGGRGKVALVELAGRDEADVRIPTQLPRKVGHFTAINDLRFAFEQAADIPGRLLAFFYGERELYRLAESSGGNAPRLLALLPHYRLIPDALAKLELGRRENERELLLAVEYDAGTERATFFGRTKVRQYASLSREHRADLEEFKVLVFAPRIRRLVGLMRQAVACEPPQGLFYFALMEDINQREWMTSEIFLDPYDYFAPVRRGERVEVVEKEAGDKAVIRHALTALPASPPGGVSPRGERQMGDKFWQDIV